MSTRYVTHKTDTQLLSSIIDKEFSHREYLTSPFLLENTYNERFPQISTVIEVDEQGVNGAITYGEVQKGRQHFMEVLGLYVIPSKRALGIGSDLLTFMYQDAISADVNGFLFYDWSDTQELGKILVQQAHAVAEEKQKHPFTLRDCPRYLVSIQNLQKIAAIKRFVRKGF